MDSATPPPQSEFATCDDIRNAINELCDDQNPHNGERQKPVSYFLVPGFD